MSGFLLVAFLAAAQQQPVQGRSNIVFARGQLGGWSMKATNVVDNEPSGPVIDRMLCEIERNGVSVMTWRWGEVAFAFGGSVGGGGRERRLSDSNVRALVVDGVSYDVERRDDGTLTDRYTDIVYPQSQIVYPPNGFFFFAMRRQGSDLWLNANNLSNELLDARRLRVGFRDSDAAPMLWIEVPLTELAAALGWCHAAMTSPNALRLHPS
jgi:hypothetical protein